jgi:DNA-binding LytR/AlgR family response regulator
MSNIKCIIIEDEPLAVKVLTDYIQQVPFLKLQGTFKDAIHATDYLRENGVDLIFLDIHLPKLKGIPFLKTLTNPPAVIITTAYHQYAVEGFEQNVTDYLLKPFDFERFLIAVNKVKPFKIENQQKDYLFINVQKKKVKIAFSEILYIESQKEYIKVVTTKKEYISKMSTNEIEELLPGHLFKRVHRSFIVSILKVESYTSEIVEVSMESSKELQRDLRLRSTVALGLVAAASPWGAKVTRVEIKDIVPPADLAGAMARQMKAEREKRAAVLEAEGARQAAVLRAEGQKTAEILAAEARREAAFRDAEARERQAEAEARATTMVSDAITQGDRVAANFLVAEKYIDALRVMASAPNQKVIIVPVEAAGLTGTLAGIAELTRSVFGDGVTPPARPPRTVPPVSNGTGRAET